MMNTVDDSFAPVKNGHVKALSNGSTNGSVTNGSLSPRLEVSNEKVSRFSTSITRVEPPGTTLYSDSNTNREEFVRLVLQTLKDIGYVYVILMIMLIANAEIKRQRDRVDS